MIYKVISFIFVISLAFGITNSNQIKDVPFDVNEIINQVSPRCFQKPNLKNPDLSLPTGEFMIDTSASRAGAPYDQNLSAIAFDGSNYLVVWQDKRQGIGHGDIYCARVTPDGIVLDRTGIQISVSARDQINPSVAFDGNNYLVVWQNYGTGGLDIYGARVTPAGSVLDPNGFLISTSTTGSGQEVPAVIYNDPNYLVVWQDNRNNSFDIYGTRVTREGVVLDTAGIPISTDTNWQRSPSIASDGSNYLVAWSDNRNGTSYDIHGTRVSQNGIVLDTANILICSANSDQTLPSIAFDGTNYLVVWNDNRNGSSENDIYGTRVNQSGVVLDTIGFPISTAANIQTHPMVVFDSTNYMVIWDDYRSGISYDIYGARVTQTGTVLDPTGIAISTAESSQNNPALAFDGTNYSVVWGDYRSGTSYDIYSARVAQTGLVLDPDGISILMIAYDQYSPAIAFDGTNYLVVWSDYRSGISNDIYGARVSQTGTILDPAGIAIATDTFFQYSPSISFDGTNYFVVWHEYRSGTGYDIYGVRVSQTGIVIDTANILICSANNDQTLPSIAFDGTNYLVAWKDYHSGTYEDICGALVSQVGSVLTEIAISTANYNQSTPSIAFDGSNYLIVWEDWRIGDYSDIYGSRVSKYGIVLDSNGIQISTEQYNQLVPSVTFDGINYFVVWHDYRSETRQDIYGARVSPNGTVLEPTGILISTTAYPQFYPSAASVAFDDTNFLIVWEENRTGVNYDIYGAKVSQSGSVIVHFPVSTQSGDQLSPTLAHGTGNEFLITYSGWTDSINHCPVNNYRIWGKFATAIGIEEKKSKVKIQSAQLLEVYPNPAKSFLAVRLPLTGDCQNLKIFDVSGKLVKEERVTSAQSHKQEVRISLKGINPEIYFLKVGKETKKFLVTR